MAIDRHLARWAEAGLITGDQAARIRDFERDRSRPTFVYAVAGLAGLAVVIGIISIIAANWDVIPGRAKIAVNLATVLALGQGVVWWDRRGNDLAREIATLVLYGLVLASIALIGQVYQLGGELHAALAAWTLFTFLLVWSGQSTGLGIAWGVGLSVTCGAWLGWLVESGRFQWALVTGISYWVPLAFLCAGRWPWLARRREAYANVFRSLGWAGVVLFGSIGAAAFYEDTRSEQVEALWIGFAGSIAATSWLFLQMNRTTGERALRWVLVVSLVLAYVPALVSPGGLDFLAALGFIGLWLTVALAAHRSGSAYVLNLATAAIGIRLIVVYFEVFGSLLGTGVGLVSGGVLTLGIVWLWARKRRDFAQDIASRGEER